jgi:hypothetical protein
VFACAYSVPSLSGVDSGLADSLPKDSYRLYQRSSTWGTLRILACMRKHLTSTKTKHSDGLKVETALTLPLTNILPRIEVLVCHKQAQLSP